MNEPRIMDYLQTLSFREEINKNLQSPVSRLLRFKKKIDACVVGAAPRAARLVLRLEEQALHAQDNPVSASDEANNTSIENPLTL